MAGVDLYGGDASRIRDTYRSALGRDASNDEVSGWLSGSYGGGGVDQWVSQISGSDEARRRQPYQFPTPGITDVIPGAQTNQPPTSHHYDQPQAQGDPWAQAREGLGNVYRQYLGRDASGDEINNWLSGAYGYGSGLENYDKYVNAIMGSHEARNYRPAGTAQEGAYQTIEWWGQQGVPAIDIFDPTTGQLRQGWARTGRGYERTGGPSPQTGGAQTTGSGPRSRSAADIAPWFTTITQGRRPSPRTLKEMEPILAQYGIRLGPPNARGWTDGIILPDGTFVDVIIGATEDGGQSWGWLLGGGHGGGGGGPQGPANQYSDPYTAFLESLIKGRIGNLGGPVNDPYRQQYMDAMGRRTQALNAAEPDYQRLISSMQSRIGDLRGPGYTGAENEAVRTGALDPIEQDRSAAKKRMIEQLAARGITLESGIAQKALADVDSAFDGMRASTQTVLTTNDLNRREGRNQRADAMEGGLYDVGQARSREQLDVFSAMDALSSLMRAEDDARQREQISLGGALADLGPQRLQLAMQAAGMGGSPQSMFQSLMQMAQLNQNSALLNQRNSGQLWSGLGSMAAILANAGR